MVSHQEHPPNLFPKKKKNPKVMASQLFYPIIWPHVSSPSELIASNEEHLSNYPEASKKCVVFDHNRIRQASGAVLDYDLSVASHLP